jgi:hypothetical protein
MSGNPGTKDAAVHERTPVAEQEAARVCAVPLCPALPTPGFQHACCTATLTPQHTSVSSVGAAPTAVGCSGRQIFCGEIVAVVTSPVRQ